MSIKKSPRCPRDPPSNTDLLAPTTALHASVFLGERTLGQTLPGHQSTPSWSGGLPCPSTTTHATHADSSVMSAAIGSVGKEDVNLPLVGPAPCQPFALNRPPACLLSAHARKIPIAAANTAGGFQLSVPTKTVKEAGEHEKRHDATGQGAGGPGEQQDDELDERHRHAYCVKEDPGRQEDGDLEGGDECLGDSPQDGDDHDHELQEEAEGENGREEADCGAEIWCQALPDAVKVLHGGTMAVYRYS